MTQTVLLISSQSVKPYSPLRCCPESWISVNSVSDRDQDVLPSPVSTEEARRESGKYTRIYCEENGRVTA